VQDLFMVMKVRWWKEDKMCVHRRCKSAGHSSVCPKRKKCTDGQADVTAGRQCKMTVKGHLQEQRFCFVLF
jgi:hypothetical protein